MVSSYMIWIPYLMIRLYVVFWHRKPSHPEKHLNFQINTSKYDENGKLVWSEKYRFLNSISNIAKNIVIDKSGDIIVVGETFSEKKLFRW